MQILKIQHKNFRIFEKSFENLRAPIPMKVTPKPWNPLFEIVCDLENFLAIQIIARKHWKSNTIFQNSSKNKKNKSSSSHSDASYADPMGEAPSRPKTAGGHGRPQIVEDEFADEEIGDDLLPDWSVTVDCLQIFCLVAPP